MTTVAQWLHRAADLPRFDCELLLQHRLGLSRAQLLTHPERPLARAELAALNAQANDLRSGQPTAYILGQQEFWGLSFTVSPDVLIPRPETELLVEQTLTRATPGAHVLDLGTGSGAIAIALAHERPDLTVTAVDKSSTALAIAADNASANGVAVNFKLSNWFAALTGQWHIIVSNPPYIAAGDPHLPALRHEPAQALVAGPHGLDDLTHIIRTAPAFLYPTGSLLLEHGYNQATAVAQLLADAGFTAAHCAPDLAGIPRVSGACLPAVKAQHQQA